MTNSGVRMIVVLTIIFPTISLAQTLRTDFRVETKGAAKINAIAKDSAGKYLIAGRFDQFESTSNSSNPAVHSLAKIDTSGNLVNSFHQPLVEGTITFIKVQSDGKIIIAGDFKRVEGRDRNKIARLNKDGRLDLDFNLNHNFYYINSIDIQSNDDLLVAGILNGPWDDPFSGKWTLDRYKKNSNEVDPNFKLSTRYSHVSKIKTDEKNRIIAVVWDSSRIAAIRILADGQIDKTFKICYSNPNADSFPLLEINEILIQKSGSIFLIGNFTSFNNITSQNVVKIDSSGNVDSSFGAAVGANFKNSLYSASLVGEDQIAVTDWNKLSIINSDGTDQSIASTSSYINNLVFADNQINKIILCGGFSWVSDLIEQVTSYKKQIVRINSDLTIDEKFNPLFNSFDQLTTIAVQEDKKLLVGGYSSKLFDVRSRKSASFLRLNKNGSVDSTLTISSLDYFDGVLAILPKSDGKILIGGQLVNYNNTIVNGVIQLNPDGSIDNSFIANQNLEQITINKIVQTDSAIFIGGMYNLSTNNSSQRLIKLNFDGSIATDFSCQLPLWIGCTVNNIKILDDKKVLVSGTFQFDGNLYFMCRLNQDGSIDSTFNKFRGLVNDFEVDTEGRIIISSNTFYYNNAQRQGIVRLLPDGTIDGTFNASYLYNGLITTVTGVDLLPNNNVIVTGNFSEFNGQAAKSILVLDTVGNIVSTPHLQFLQPTYVNNSIFNDGILYLVGGIYAPNYQSSVAMIDFNYSSLNIDLKAEASTDNVRLNWSTTAHDSNVKGYRIERLQENLDFVVVDSVDSLVPQYIDAKVNNDNTYTYRISAIYNWGASNYSNTAVAKLSSVTSIEKNESDIVIYPNPVNNLLSIIIPKDDSIQKIHLHNSSGLKIPVNIISSELDLTPLSSGLYIITIITEKKSTSIKLIKR